MQAARLDFLLTFGSQILCLMTLEEDAKPDLESGSHNCNSILVLLGCNSGVEGIGILGYQMRLEMGMFDWEVSSTKSR